jgi:intraflagellar transport protein 122
LIESTTWQGKFKEAADAYIEAGQVSMAMEMYTDLWMFEEAKALAETTVRLK